MARTHEPNAEHPRFEKLRREIQDLYFRRNPELWPIFADPTCQQITAFRQRGLLPAEAMTSYPDGPMLGERLRATSSLPPRGRHPSDGPDPLLPFAASLSKNWEDPACVENVITMASDPAIFGMMLGTLANPNLVYYDYAEMAAELEKAVIRQIAELAGYDPDRSTGIFTQGGTMCNLYGYLMGIRKSLPMSRLYGVGARQDYRMINSQGGHYSNMTNLSLLGVNIRDKVIRVRMTDRNQIDLANLEEHLRACFRLGCAVPTIMLTMGTTDTFAVDDIESVWRLREALCEEFEVTVKPHIHVDSTVGWPMLFFVDYDFGRNPLRINSQTLFGLAHNAELFRGLRYADSFAVDFQKWGYVPYTSSLVMIRDRADLDALNHDPENFSYFEPGLRSHTHMQSTIECSRGAAGVFGAHAALNYMGVRGYQIAIAHCLQNANYLRHRLADCRSIKVIAPDNQGPSVCFRIYDPEAVSDAEAEFAYEQAFVDSPEYLDRVAANTDFHRQGFIARRKHGLLTNWVQSVGHSSYSPTGDFMVFPGEKAVFVNPLTGRRQIDAFIDKLHDQLCETVDFHCRAI